MRSNHSFQASLQLLSAILAFAGSSALCLFCSFVQHRYASPWGFTGDTSSGFRNLFLATLHSFSLVCAMQGRGTNTSSPVLAAPGRQFGLCTSCKRRRAEASQLYSHKNAFHCFGSSTSATCFSVGCCSASLVAVLSYLYLIFKVCNCLKDICPHHSVCHGLGHCC